MNLPGRRHMRIRLSDVMCALSHALDLVEGQRRGHSVRSCIMGMRIADVIGLSSDQRSSLFYALLMKDLGCSSNAAKMCFLFSADDRSTKGAIKTVNWRNIPSQLKFAFGHVARGKPLLTRIARVLKLVAAGDRAGKELIQIRCERGAQIARLFGLSEETAQSIHCLDEHFDGGGHPAGLIGDQIPVCARIMGLTQTAEVFHSEHGIEAMRAMVAERRGTWFDPQLADALLSVKDSDPLWAQMAKGSNESVAQYEPQSATLFADDARLDSIAFGFAQVIDAKSPWTFRHSLGVSEIAVGISETMGLPTATIRDVRRAALLHDIGKLGVSNLILDKPGKLTNEEFAAVKMHPSHTFDILSHVAGFDRLADLAASHHERLDGKGYHRGRVAAELSTEARILAVSDVYEALASKRPYREDLCEDEVMTIMTRNVAGGGCCPEVFEALRAFIGRGTFVPQPAIATPVVLPVALPVAA